MASALALPFDRKGARRRLSRHIVEDAAQVTVDPCVWHDYELQWKTDSSEFRIDGRLLLGSEISARPPLGIVIWIDNQYAAFDPDGGLAWGCESNAQAAWMDIEGLNCQHNAGAF